jgi:hypothetical protein
MAWKPTADFRFSRHNKTRNKNQESRNKIKEEHECMVAWMHDLTADRRQRTAVKDQRKNTIEIIIDEK